MKRTMPAGHLTVRPYRGEDEPGVLALLNAALQGGPAGEITPAFFRWKHLDGPFGPSFMLVAEAGRHIVGLRAFMRWELRSGDRSLRAVRAVDTATHPDHQGRGIFSRLTREALDALAEEADFVFNTPNSKSLPGYLKMGWRTAGKLPVNVRVRRPIRFAREVRRLRTPAGPAGQPPRVRAEGAAAALADDGLLAELLGEAGGVQDARLVTPRDASYLRWRYALVPSLDYRAVREIEGGRTRGLAIFRVRPRGPLWEATVAELIAPAGDGRTARRLLRGVIEAARVDHATGLFPAGSGAARAARRTGFVPSPSGITFVVNPLHSGVEPDPADLRCWALSLGDVEVF